MMLWPRITISPTSPCGTSWSFSSTIRISHFSIGVPIEPGLRTWFGCPEEATGEVSESP